MARSTPHDLAEKPYYGTPRTLPMALLCNSNPDEFCGRVWTANTMEQYNQYLEERKGHEAFCSAAVQSLDLALAQHKVNQRAAFPHVTLN